MRLPFRPARTLLTFSVALLSTLALGGLPASGSNPSGAPFHQEVWAGVDYDFDSSTYAYMGNYDYVGDDEGPIQDCVRVSSPADERTNVPTCWADRATGQSKSRVHLQLRNQQYNDPDARSGVGFAYHLQPRCEGQTWDSSHPLTLTMEYQRAVSVDTAGGGVAFAEVWGNPSRGRGYEGATDPLQPPQPVDASMVNRRIGLWDGATNLALAQAPPAVFEFVPGAEGDYEALVYSHAHGTAAVSETEAMAHAQVDLDLTGVTFDWTDTVPPTIESVSWSNTAPAVARDGFTWWTSWPQLNVYADDDFSCPHMLTWTPRVAGPVPASGHCWSNKVCSFLLQGEGRYHGDVRVLDGQLNPSTESREVRAGVDASPPTLTMETVPAAPDGANGWFVTAPRIRFTCVDAFSGCDKVSWTDGNVAWHHETFPVTPGVPATVETGALPSGRNGGLCSARDLAGWTDACDAEVLVDLGVPSARIECSTAGPNGPWLLCEGGPRWYAVDTWFRAACYDWVQGSWPLSARHRVDGGAWSEGVGPAALPVAASGTVRTFEVQCSDPAGHAATSSVVVGSDTVPPAAPAVTVRSGRQWFAVGERPWLDFPTTDDASGVKEYRIHENGVYQRTVAVPEVEMWTANQGTRDVEVRAVDHAGNVGPAGTVSYAFDGTFPRGSLTSPYQGAVYVNGQSFTPSVPLGKAVSVGSPVPVAVHSWDDESGLAWARVTATKVLPAPAQDLGELRHCTQMPCSTTYTPPPPRTATEFRDYVRTYHFTAAAEDKVGHFSQYTGTDVEYVSMAAGGARTAAGIPYVGTDWVRYDGGDFVRYEVHRGVTSDFQPGLATKVFETANRDTTSFRDKTAVVDQTYFYRVKLVTATDSALSNMYPARVASGVAGAPDAPQYLDRGMYTY